MKFPICLLVMISNLECATAKLPEYFLTCRRSDPYYQACMEKSVQHTVKYLRAGRIKGLRKLEPITLARTEFYFDMKGYPVHAVLNSTTITNLCYFDVKSVSFDGTCVILDITIPFAQLTSNGSLTTPYVKAEGVLYIKGEFIDLALKLCGKKVKSKNMDQLKFDYLKIKLEIPKYRTEIRCDNALKQKLFNMGFAFSDKRIMDRTMPYIINTSETQLLDTVQKLTNAYSYPELYPA